MILEKIKLSIHVTEMLDHGMNISKVFKGKTGARDGLYNFVENGKS